MASILLKDMTFSPDATRIVGEAFDHPTIGLHDTGQPIVVREIIAKRIVDLIGSGESEPQKLARMALASVGISEEWALKMSEPSLANLADETRLAVGISDDPPTCTKYAAPMRALLSSPDDVPRQQRFHCSFCGSER